MNAGGRGLEVQPGVCEGVPSASRVVTRAPSGEWGYHGVKSFLTEKGMGFPTAWECALALSETSVNLTPVPG